MKRLGIVLLIAVVLVLGVVLFRGLALEKPTLPAPSPMPATPTLEAVASPSAAAPSITVPGTSREVEQTGAGTIYEYTSPGLGISFRYLSSEELRVYVFGNGDTICVTYDRNDETCKRGQSVQVFWKDPREQFPAAIKRVILAGYSESDCFLEPLDRGPDASIPGFAYAEISFPKSDNPSIPDVFGPNASQCPEQYRKTGTIRYFSMDTKHPDRFFFFNIGQSIIPAGSEPWDETLTVL